MVLSKILFTSRTWGISIAFIFGIAFGLGVYTFIYARGLSYLSSDPEACVNCHAMNQVFEGWVSGDHHHVAACNDCHLPHNAAWKWIIKSENGLYHSLVFTFMNVPMNIRARESSRNVVRENCRRCHAVMASNAITNINGRELSLDCLKCHRRTGHAHH
ncbi:MAG TPA: cytochrome c nitrite reductase small subunit [Spirochaetota bacterium]|nr:cytochrome c nitrite reductase small subunit [Spirochaetota bacterium]